MNLRTLFLFLLVLVGLTSFTKRIGDSIEPTDPSTGDCMGGSQPCGPSPGRMKD
jgi:hypothetical protein